MKRYIYTIIVNVCLLTIPMYVIYDGMMASQQNTPDGSSPQLQPNDVIINTYMRAGSSFLGKMLGFRDDTFYVYEPLWLFHRYGYYRGMREICWTFSPGCSKNTDFYTALRFMRSLYDCNFVKYSKYFKENIHQKMSGPSWGIYQSCRKNKGQEDITSCLHTEVAVCKNAKHRVSKVLRLSLDIMHIFLNERSNLKVVHLVRDPRGLINSHFQTAWSPLRRRSTEKQLTNAARAICERTSRDIDIGEKLLEKYPGRFKIVQYEDFDDPAPKINKLYNFLGMSNAKETEKYIAKPDTNTDSASAKGSIKGNHPFQYRTSLDWSTVEIIDHYCSGVYEKLGYTKFENETMFRDLSISPIRSKLTYRL